MLWNYGSRVGGSSPLPKRWLAACPVTLATAGARFAKSGMSLVGYAAILLAMHSLPNRDDDPRGILSICKNNSRPLCAHASFLPRAQQSSPTPFQRNDPFAGTPSWIRHPTTSAVLSKDKASIKLLHTHMECLVAEVPLEIPRVLLCETAILLFPKTHFPGTRFSIEPWLEQSCQSSDMVSC